MIVVNLMDIIALGLLLIAGLLIFVLYAYFSIKDLVNRRKKK